MPQENSSTHTPLFSSGFSQLYTQLPSHNRSRISMSAQKLSAQPVKPEAKSMISDRKVPLKFFFFFFIVTAEEKLSFPNVSIFVHLPVWLPATSTSPSYSLFFVFYLCFSPPPRLSSARPSPSQHSYILLHVCPSRSAVRIKHLSWWSFFGALNAREDDKSRWDLSNCEPLIN